jgi:RNA polymerase sigma-70 factor (ECF subfamily)
MSEVRTIEELTRAYLEYCPLLKRLILRHVRDPEEARDLLQEVWIKLARSLENSGPIRHPPSYIGRTAITTALMARRSASSRPSLEPHEGGIDERPDHRPGPDICVAGREISRRLSEAVASLPPRKGRMIALRYGGEMSYEELAEALAVPKGTVKTVLFRTIRDLRETLSADLAA